MDPKCELHYRRLENPNVVAVFQHGLLSQTTRLYGNLALKKVLLRLAYNSYLFGRPKSPIPFQP